MTSSTTDYSISIKDSHLIKGIAICCMLWHHLFYQHPEFGNIVYFSALMGKVCVSLFLIISAYGLTIQFDKAYSLEQNKVFKPNALKNFYINRFSKLYGNYWVIFILSISIGVFIFNRSLSSVYGGNIAEHLIIDLFGLGGMQSYNITWWFYQLIIPLYVLFPVLFFVVKKWNIYILSFSFCLLWTNLFTIPIFHSWLFYFCLGISLAQNSVRINNLLNSFRDIRLLFAATIFFLIIYFRCAGTPMTCFLSVAIILLTQLTVRKFKYPSIIGQYLGNHSMNIFMIHTFIFYYFYPDFIYSFKQPIIIFIVLLSTSLAISVIIEYIKQKAGFYKLIKIIKQHTQN